ncbi:MAG TPA: LLM class F420-dependent oxidoreductase [Candidatus Binataceae bacterium]|nr:LLM class F420-dependent oxidoreductase [Candidatus Binataceae bacterium]
MQKATLRVGVFSRMVRHGITAPLEAFQNQHFVELVRTAERCGYVDVWSFESFATDAFAPLAAAAMIAPKMRLGTAIVPVFTRPPALIAMSAATVQQLSSGRFVLGLGISSRTIVEQWMGVPFEHPLTRLRETVAAIRDSFRGGKVNFSGKTVHINGFRLSVTLDTPPPIYLGAQGAKMLRLAGEIGDGLITNFVTPATLPAMLEHVREGRRAAGKDPAAPLDVVCRIMIAVDDDEEKVRAELRRHLTAYVTVPTYNAFFREIGFEREARLALEAWNAGDRKAALASLPERMIEEIYVFGSVANCRRRLEQYLRAGVTTTALEFESFAPDPKERRARILRAAERLAPA